MIIEEKYTLWNGVEIPKLGFGTWLISNEDAGQAVKDALNSGYRHIDTAQAYQNEGGVREAVRGSEIKREELFITTKLAAELKSYKEAAASIDKSLETLGSDYIDLMIIHSPQPWAEFGGENRYYEGNREAWRALEEAHESGKLRAIGVSNFQKEDIDNILDVCKIKPMVNQILVHISKTPLELIEYSRKNDLLVEAYSPIAHGKLLKNRDVKKMAEKYNVSVAQLSIRYILQLGLLPLPKSTNPRHIKANTEVDFVITKEDMGLLKHMEPIKD